RHGERLAPGYRPLEIGRIGHVRVAAPARLAGLMGVIVVMPMLIVPVVVRVKVIVTVRTRVPVLAACMAVGAMSACAPRNSGLPRSLARPADGCADLRIEQPHADKGDEPPAYGFYPAF